MTESPVRNQGWWAPVPEALILDPDVSHLALRVWCILRRHGDSPDNCYPSHRRIGEMLGVSPRSIQRPLRELESAGWIERFERSDGGGARLADGYVVRCERAEPDTPADEGGAHENVPPAQTCAGPPRKPARGPRANVRGPYKEQPEPVNQSHRTRDTGPPAQRSVSTELELVADASPPSATVSDSVTVADRWERFWAMYPRKVGKQAARKAWDRARKKRDPAEIQAALESHLPAWGTIDEQFIPHPATWLNQGRYDDPPPKPRTASGTDPVAANRAKIAASLARLNGPESREAGESAPRNASGGSSGITTRSGLPVASAATRGGAR